MNKLLLTLMLTSCLSVVGAEQEPQDSSNESLDAQVIQHNLDIDRWLTSEDSTRDDYRSLANKHDKLIVLAINAGNMTQVTKLNANWEQVTQKATCKGHAKLCLARGGLN